MKKLLNLLLILPFSLWVAVACSPKLATPTKVNESEKVTQYDITKGLIAYYPLDGDAKNMADDFYHGKTKNTKLTKNRNGEEGKALYFNGDSYVDLGIEFPSLAGSKNYSVSCWFKTPNSGHIISRFDGGVEGEFIIGLSDGKAYFSRNVEPWHTIGINNYDDNEWHHLVAIYDGKKVLVYMDGVLDTSTEMKNSPGASNTPVLIGNSKTKGKIGLGPYTGIIDELRIYSRVISKKEIVELFEKEE